MGIFQKERCGWCGFVIIGKPVSPFHSSEMIGMSGGREIELLPAFDCGFCSAGCAWAFAEQHESLHGMRGRELHEHLELQHGLKCEVCSRQQSAESRSHFETERKVIDDWMMKLRIADNFQSRTGERR